MQEQLTELAAFQTKVRAVRAAPRKERMALAKALVATDGIPPLTDPVAFALLRLLRDSTDTPEDWNAVIDFARALPKAFAEQAEAREQLAFAVSQTGSITQSIGELETLIEAVGPTPERLGLLGGRYKRLIKSSTASDAERQVYLAKSIQAYERGMDLDLNDYYCSSNLPRLYRQRNRKGDEERAQTVLRLVIAACERAKRRNVTDESLRPTLLGASFDAGDADKAEELVDDIVAEGSARWKLDSVLNDLQISAQHVADAAQRERLLAVVAQLKLV